MTRGKGKYRSSIFDEMVKHYPTDELVHHATDPGTGNVFFLWRGKQPTRKELIEAELVIETHVKIRRTDGPGYVTSAVYVPTRAEAERKIDEMLTWLNAFHEAEKPAQKPSKKRKAAA